VDIPRVIGKRAIKIMFYRGHNLPQEGHIHAGYRMLAKMFSTATLKSELGLRSRNTMPPS